MSCDCIKRIEKLMNEKMVEKYPGGEVVDEWAFTNKRLAIDNEGNTALVLSNPGLGKVRVGKAIRIFDARCAATYCPFCGKKIREGGEK